MYDGRDGGGGGGAAAGVVAAAGEQQQQIALPEPHQLAAVVARGVGRFAVRYKYVSGTFLIGWIFAFVIGNGIPLTAEQRRDYKNIMASIDLQTEFDASQKYYVAYGAYRASRGWFFWSCDSLCQRNKDRMRRAERELQAVRDESAARVRDAKGVAGLFSEVGVGEVKDSFWQYFHRGKLFAKRQTMWDAMVLAFRQMTSGGRGRDESWIEYGLKVLVHVLINFSLGLCMALVMFVFGLWNIVRSYQANPVTAVVFFLLSAAAAFSFVATYIAAMLGAAGFGVYGVLKVAETSQRRARLQQQGERIRVTYGGGRPHND